MQVMAKGGEILVANVVRQLAEGKDFMFGDRGEVALWGFDDPGRLRPPLPHPSPARAALLSC